MTNDVNWIVLVTHRHMSAHFDEVSAGVQHTDSLPEIVLPAAAESPMADPLLGRRPLSPATLACNRHTLLEPDTVLLSNALHSPAKPTFRSPSPGEGKPPVSPDAPEAPWPDAPAPPTNAVQQLAEVLGVDVPTATLEALVESSEGSVETAVSMFFAGASSESTSPGLAATKGGVAEQVMPLTDGANIIKVDLTSPDSLPSPTELGPVAPTPSAPVSAVFTPLADRMDPVLEEDAPESVGQDVLLTPVSSPGGSQGPALIGQSTSTSALPSALPVAAAFPIAEIPPFGGALARPAAPLLPVGGSAPPIIPPRSHASFEADAGNRSVKVAASPIDVVQRTPACDRPDTVKYSTDESDFEYEQGNYSFGFSSDGTDDDEDDNDNDSECPSESVDDYQSDSSAATANGHGRPGRTATTVASGAPSDVTSGAPTDEELPPPSDVTSGAPTDEELPPPLLSPVAPPSFGNSAKFSAHVPERSLKPSLQPDASATETFRDSGNSSTGPAPVPIPPASATPLSPLLPSDLPAADEALDVRRTMSVEPYMVSGGGGGGRNGAVIRNKGASVPHHPARGAQRVASMAEAVRRTSRRPENGMTRAASQMQSMEGKIYYCKALSLTKQATASIGKRKWVPYFAQLKGNMLLLKRTAHDNTVPAAALQVQNADKTYCLEQCICQRIKLEGRYNTFAIGLPKEGTVVHMQANDENIVSNWIRAIHAAAGVCEARVTNLIDCAITLVEKLDRHRHGLAQARQKHKDCQADQNTVENQRNVIRWKFEVELLTTFRLGCYLAAVDYGTTLPDETQMFSEISDTTMAQLDELGDSSRHVTGLMMVLGPLYKVVRSRTKNKQARASKTRSSIFGRRRSSLTPPSESPGTALRGVTSPGRRRASKSKRAESAPVPSNAASGGNSAAPHSAVWDTKLSIRVQLPGDTFTDLPRQPSMRVKDAFHALKCEIVGNPITWYLTKADDELATLLSPTEILDEGVQYKLNVKPVHDVHLTRPHYGSFGFQFTVADGQVLVTQVEANGGAEYHGLNTGDEIIEINGENVAKNLERAVHQLRSEYQAVMKVIPSNPLAQQTNADRKRELDFTLLMHMVAPPPSFVERFEDELILPSPGDFGLAVELDAPPSKRDDTHAPADLDEAGTDELIVRMFSDCGEATVLTKEMKGLIRSPELASKKKTWQLRARIYELLDTEMSYVQDLTRFVDRFIDPVLSEKFVSRREKQVLQGCYFPEMIALHEEFAAEMQQCIDAPGSEYLRMAGLHLTEEARALPEPEMEPELESELGPEPPFTGPVWPSLSLGGGMASIAENPLSPDRCDSAPGGGLGMTVPTNAAETVAGSRSLSLRTARLARPAPTTAPSGEAYRRVVASLYSISTLFETKKLALRHVYSDFIVFQDRAKAVLNGDSNPKLCEFLRNRIPGPEITKQIDSYMIKPVQRLTKYPLLLKEILRDVGKDDGIEGELKPVQAAFEHAMDLATYINEFENIARALSVCKELPRMSTLKHKADVFWLNEVDDHGKAVPVKKQAFPQLTLLVFADCTMLLRKPAAREHLHLMTVASNTIECYATTELPSAQKAAMKVYSKTAWVLSNSSPTPGQGPTSLTQLIFASAEQPDRDAVLVAIKASSTRMSGSQTVAV